MSKPEFDTVEDIRCHHRGKWFHPSNMRFFRSRLLPTVYQGPGGVYFVSSEQFVGSETTHERRYTVRQYDVDNDDIKTVHGFNEHTKAKAKLLARVSASMVWPDRVPRGGKADKETCSTVGR